MRREDSERLARPYGPEAPDGTHRLAAALGIPLPRVGSLFGAVFQDLDAKTFGVGWWAPHPGTARRILISDHLVCCLYDLETNLVEAKIHLLEALGHQEEANRAFVGAVRVPRVGPLSVSHPPLASPVDEIRRRGLTMHLVGCVRALASALDCFAGAIVGVLALRASIYRSGYKEVRTLLGGCQAGGECAQQREGAAELLEVVRRAGPDGWEQWVLGYRNMLVHRGRRLQPVKLRPTGARLYVPDGSKVVPHAQVPVLPNDPDRSDVEVLRDGPERDFLLTESAWATLEGAVVSVHGVLEGGSEILERVWEWRRAHPKALSQPREQWKNAKTGAAIFRGYEPGSVPFDPTEFRSNPAFVARITAAALTDPQRDNWETFD